MASQYKMKSPKVKTKVKKGRMYVYLWHYIDEPNKVKFGQTFVIPDEDGETAVIERIRESIGVNKLDYDNGLIIVDGFWDVSEIAESVNRNYPKAKMDDYIRPTIGYRENPRSEKHLIDYQEALLRINKYINSWGVEREQVGLSPWQYAAAESIIAAIENGKKITLAELCARFGKTIWAAAVACELNSPLTIIGSYVLTSFASFKNELAKYEQFRNIVVVEASNPTYQADIETALDNGHQVIVLLSMVTGSLRQERVDFLFGRPEPRLVFIDEADYGAHTDNQTEPFIAAVKPDDKIVLMTGTNGDRACGNWNVDNYLSVVYPELLIAKKETMNGGAVYRSNTLKKFAIDYSRVEMVVDMEFYQLDVNNALAQAMRVDPAIMIDSDNLPSWTKFSKKPSRAKGFWVRMLEAMFLGKNNLDELNISYQTNVSNSFQVSMMFLPGGMTNKDLKDVVAYTQETLKGWVILEISGASTYNGESINNENAERISREVVAKAKETNTPVVILSRGMAQRSYSVGEITNLFLCYDEGDGGATTQKISRALTPFKLGKVARVFSLSFDPNRDDKFDAMMYEAAQNIAKRDKIEIEVAQRKVISTIDIFAATEDGAVKINPDEYLQQLLENNRLSRMLGKQADLTKMSMDEIAELATGNIAYDSMDKTDVAPRGKTYSESTPSKPRASMDREEMSVAEKARKVLVTIVEHLPYLTFMTNQTTIRDSLTACINDSEYHHYVTQEFSVTPQKILEFFDRGILNYDLASLQKSAKVNKLTGA
jgi:hypothetical protein